jgi:hypothetical protein
MRTLVDTGNLETKCAPSGSLGRVRCAHKPLASLPSIGRLFVCLTEKTT